ncbi:MAG: hypothetical protein AAGG68_16665 [Bacteroidota bacterium]
MLTLPFPPLCGEKGVDLEEKHHILLTAKYGVSPPNLLREPPKAASIHVFQNSRVE